jgi:hypothetical protein
MIVGITGYKRVGKDTAAKVFEARGFHKYALAEPIKRACMSLFEWSSDEIEERKEEIDPRWGISPRRAMQVIGTEMFRKAMPDIVPGFSRSFWIDRMVAEYKRVQPMNMVVPDVRFPDEAMKIYYLGGTVIKVNRKGLFDDKHESESYIDQIPADFVVDNDGDEIDFIRSINYIVKELENVDLLATVVPE